MAVVSPDQGFAGIRMCMVVRGAMCVGMVVRSAIHVVDMRTMAVELRKRRKGCHRTVAEERQQAPYACGAFR
jgi:hypothetical protein